MPYQFDRDQGTGPGLRHLAKSQQFDLGQGRDVEVCLISVRSWCNTQMSWFVWVGLPNVLTLRAWAKYNIVPLACSSVAGKNPSGTRLGHTFV